MIDVAKAINSFLPDEQQADFVSPSDQLIVLTYSQLQNFIKEAIQPLQDEVSQLREDNITLKEKIAAVEATQDIQADNQLIQLRLIGQIREAIKKEPQPLQKDRGDILRALLAANGGKMLAKEARQKMRMSRSAFSQLISTMADYIEVKPFHLKKNQKVIILKSCLAKQ